MPALPCAPVSEEVSEWANSVEDRVRPLPAVYVVLVSVIVRVVPDKEAPLPVTVSHAVALAESSQNRILS